MELKEALTFNDVLLKPNKTSIKSRSDIDIRTKLSRNIALNIPIISANMDTVTESRMAKTMARYGGIGIIHRFLTIDSQVKEVEKVKRAESIIIENPYTLTPNRTLQEAKDLMIAKGVTGLLITDPSSKLVGILTKRDLLFETSFDQKVSEVMSKELITAPPTINLEDAKNILKKNKIEKLPLVDKEGYLKGLITSSDIIKREKYPNACKDKKGRLRVGAAIGVKQGFLERAEALLQAGCDVLVIDIAHGHSTATINTIKMLRESFGKVEIIAGNVATAEGTKDLIEAGADAVKVGVGGGSICITRIVAGAGVPQLTAINDCAKVAKDYDIPIIADGGITTSGDIVKAIAAGASSVMIGSLFAGTNESPGIPITRNGQKYKLVRGMASLEATIVRSKKEGTKEKEFDQVVPEGVEATVPYRGSVKEMLVQLTGGLRSGMSYSGARTIKELWEKARFVKITTAGWNESKPHDVSLR